MALSCRQRTNELISAHEAEMDSQRTQQQHQAQMLLSEFNNAKALFAHKIGQLENQ